MLFIPKKFFLCGKPDINRLAGTPVLFHEGAKNFNLDTIYQSRTAHQRRSALYLLVLPDQETGDTRLS